MKIIHKLLPLILIAVMNINLACTQGVTSTNPTSTPSENTAAQSIAMTGSVDATYVGYSMVAVQTNSPGTIVGSGTIDANGNFQLPLSLSVDANVQLVMLDKDGNSIILVTFMSGTSSSSTIMVRKDMRTVAIGRATVSNGSAVVNLTGDVQLGKKADREDMFVAVRARFPKLDSGCRILAYRPTANANVGPGQKPKLWFSQAVDTKTLASISLMMGSTAIAGKWRTSAQGKQAMFVPTNSLAAGNYSFKVAPGVTCNGTALTPFSDTTFTVQTNSGVEEDDGDSSSTTVQATLSVTSIAPTNTAKNIAVTASIAVTFSDAIDSATAAGNISLATAANVAVNGTTTVSADGKTVTFTPTTSLQANTAYTVTVNTPLTATILGAKVSLASVVTSTFTTA